MNTSLTTTVLLPVPLEAHGEPVVDDLELAFAHQKPAAFGGAVVVGSHHRWR